MNKWVIGGGLLFVVIIGYIYFKGGGLPNSTAGSSIVQVPNTQELMSEQALADAIARLSVQVNALNHPANDGSSPTIPPK